MIELGGNIKLDGFHELDPSTLIVVKKIVGNYAKRINDTIAPVQELMLCLTNNDQGYDMSVRLTCEQCSRDVNSSDTNLFFALDKALSKVLQEATHTT